MCTLLGGVFSALQVLLLFDMTFGLSPFLFALGDDAFSDFIGGIQFLPTTIMVSYIATTTYGLYARRNGKRTQSVFEILS